MSFKNKKHTKETKEKISKANKNNKSKIGQKDSLETIKKKSLAQRGEKHRRWSGNNPSYEALHSWIKRYKKKTNCDFCNSNKFVELSNKSGEYKRNLKDWQYLCSKCHHAFDKGKNSIRKKYGRIK